MNTTPRPLMTVDPRKRDGPSSAPGRVGGPSSSPRREGDDVRKGAEVMGVDAAEERGSSVALSSRPRKEWRRCKRLFMASK